MPLPGRVGLLAGHTPEDLLLGTSEREALPLLERFAAQVAAVLGVELVEKPAVGDTSSGGARTSAVLVEPRSRIGPSNLRITSRPPDTGPPLGPQALQTARAAWWRLSGHVTKIISWTLCRSDGMKSCPPEQSGAPTT